MGGICLFSRPQTPKHWQVGKKSQWLERKKLPPKATEKGLVRQVWSGPLSVCPAEHHQGKVRRSRLWWRLLAFSSLVLQDPGMQKRTPFSSFRQGPAVSVSQALKCQIVSAAPLALTLPDLPQCCQMFEHSGPQDRGCATQQKDADGDLLT